MIAKYIKPTLYTNVNFAIRNLRDENISIVILVENISNNFDNKTKQKNLGIRPKLTPT